MKPEKLVGIRLFQGFVSDSSDCPNFVLMYHLIRVHIDYRAVFHHCMYKYYTDIIHRYRILCRVQTIIFQDQYRIKALREMILLMIKKKSKFLKIHKYRLQSWSFHGQFRILNSVG